MAELKDLLIKNIKSKIDDDINDISNEIENINEYIIKCNESGLHTEITVKFIHIIEYKNSTDKLSDNLYMYSVSSIFSIPKLLNTLMSHYKNEGFDVVTNYSDYIKIKWDKILSKEDCYIEYTDNTSDKITNSKNLLPEYHTFFYKKRMYKIKYTTENKNVYVIYKISVTTDTGNGEVEVYRETTTSVEKCIDRYNDIYNNPEKYFSKYKILENALDNRSYMKNKKK